MLKVVFVLGCLLSLTLAKPVSEIFLCSSSIIPIFEYYFYDCNSIIPAISNLKLLDFLQMGVAHKRLARSFSGSDSGSNSFEVSVFSVL